jgi:hypothetical protein
MKKLIYAFMLMTALALTPVRNAYVKDTPSFEIYLTAEPMERGFAFGKSDWSHIRLAEKPLISASDIIRYDFSQHAMKLRPEAFDRIPSRTPWEGTPFVVVVNGERIYLGGFRSGIESFRFEVPNILIGYLAWERQPRDILVIERGYPANNVAPDSRTDPRIKSALTALGLISDQPTLELKSFEGVTYDAVVKIMNSQAQ